MIPWTTTESEKMARLVSTFSALGVHETPNSISGNDAVEFIDFVANSAKLVY
jgi:hypothetical protein